MSRVTSLRVRQRHGLTIEETVTEYLRGRRLLLVLDNCEHVLGAAACLVDRVVQRILADIEFYREREVVSLQDLRDSVGSNLESMVAQLTTGGHSAPPIKPKGSPSPSEKRSGSTLRRTRGSSPG